MAWLLLLALTSFLFLFTVLLVFLRKLIQLSNTNSRNNLKMRTRNISGKNVNNASSQMKQFSCAFFHPNCSAGGGGERTLFAAILSIKSRFPDAKLAIFIKANVKNQNSVSEIRKKAMDDFNLIIPEDMLLIPLKTVFLAENGTWPRFTLIGQILGSAVLAFEAMFRFRPDVLIDTAGFPFIYPIIRKVFNCKLVAYVHYPFISTDMIQKLQSKSFNNSGLIASNWILRRAKIVYYSMLIKIYSICGLCCDLSLTNSTWTNNHMIRLWRNCPMVKIVYPPCDLNPFTNLKLGESKATIQVVSLSQFRPEKNHRLQLEIAAKVIEKDPTVKFVFVGGCRGPEDENRVKELKQYAAELNISESVQFKVNLPFTDLLSCLQASTIGLHTMTDEHFGIGIVELMAAGLITIAHNSGGPRADIIKKGEGFLCASASEYAEMILKIAGMTQEERMKISEKGRISAVSRFSGDIFHRQFSDNLAKVMC